MKIQKSVLLALSFFLLVTHQSRSFSALHQDFQQFEQQLLTNEAVIEFSPLKDGKLEPIESIQTTRATPKKAWTFIVYMAADNDLRAFAANNLKQMASVGSNNNINIVVHLDIRLNGNQKITRRYFVEKNKINHMNLDPATQCMDSGDPQTLISCCKWAINNYPAHNYALTLWNHGTGIIDPKYYKIVNPAELFMFNPATNKFDLDRTIGFLDLLNYVDLDQRGICWDNTTGNFLTNQKLEFALKEICTNIIHGKLKLIGFDACLMSMVEIGSFIKHYAEVMVGSQEVELGTGWNYAHILKPIANGPIDNKTLARQIVSAYSLSYQQITHDFTQSAIDLNKMHGLEQNVDLVGKLLLECLQKQRNNSVHNAIQESRNRKTCTHFDEPSYIDLHHFYTNLQANIGKFRLTSSSGPIDRLIKALADGKLAITQAVFANITGKNLKNAKGISIYFPEQRIHPSYEKSRFATENGWAKFIQKYKG